MASEDCFWLIGCVFFIFHIQDPWDVAALDRMIIWRLDCCGDDTEGIAADEFVECREVEIRVYGP